MSDTVSYAHTGPTQMTWRLSDDLSLIDLWVLPYMAEVLLGGALSNRRIAARDVKALEWVKNHTAHLHEKAFAARGVYPNVRVHIVDSVPDIPPKENPDK